MRLPDARVASFAFGAGLVALVVRAPCDVDPEASRDNRSGVVAVLLAGAAVALHTPMLLLAGPFGAAAAFVLVRRRPPPSGLLAVLGVVLLVLVPWAVRGLVQSGFPLHPFALLGGAMPWSVPAASLAVARRALQSGPLDQIPLDADVLLGRLAAGWTWGRLVVVPLVMAAFFLGTYALLRLFTRGVWPRGPVLSFLPVLTAGALWLAPSGDLHEGALLPWLVAGQCCALAVGHRAHGAGRRARRRDHARPGAVSVARVRAAGAAGAPAGGRAGRGGVRRQVMRCPDSSRTARGVDDPNRSRVPSPQHS